MDNLFRRRESAMSRQVNVVFAGVVVCFAMLISGCGSSTAIDLSLKFTPEESATYKSTSGFIKDYRFEQPNLGKLREEQTKTAIEMTFDQTIESVDAEGNAIANITIKQLVVNIVNKNENKFAFDSTNEKDASSPMASLLGKSYKIQISPIGDVKVLDAEDARTAIKTGYEKKLAGSILDDKSIIQRHQVESLPKDIAPNLAVGASWDKVVPSPPGLLAPKSYKKTYTLSDVEMVDNTNIATVKMVASEDAEPVKEVSSGSMGMFAKMFDNEDSYNGSMTIDLNTGTLRKAEETLVSTYLAQETPDNGDPAKGPDTLTMTFTNRIVLEKLD